MSKVAARSTTSRDTLPDVLHAIRTQTRTEVPEPRRRVARGTTDAEDIGLTARVEARLAQRPAPVAELAGEFGESAAKVSSAVRRLVRAGRVANVGSDTDPRWFAVVGDDTPTAALRAAIEQLLTYRPMTAAELCALTGSRHGRVQGVLVEYKRNSRRLLNLGGPRQGLWFLAPEDIEVVLKGLDYQDSPAYRR